VHENKDEMATRHGTWCGSCRRGSGPDHLPAGDTWCSCGRRRDRRGQRAPGQGNVAFEGKEPGDFIDPGQAGLAVGESKVQEAIKKAVTKPEKQTAREPGLDPKDVDQALPEAVREI
jgi:hypothetical protein